MKSLALSDSGVDQTLVSPAWVRFQRPEMPGTSDILRYFALSQEAGFYSNGGPCATLLSERLASYLGGDVICIPVNNCTSGLMVALRALCGRRRGPRRRVICPSYTFTATGCAIAWCDFEPVFVDVEPNGWHLDPDALDRALSRLSGSIAGVLACCTFGTAPGRAASGLATCLFRPRSSTSIGLCARIRRDRRGGQAARKLW